MMHCVMCGRSMRAAAVLIAGHAVGPTCARKRGLMPLAAKRVGEVRPGPAYRASATRIEVDQLELFEVAV
jgi:hypothetical protein